MSEDIDNADGDHSLDQGQDAGGPGRMYPPPANFRLFLESLLSQAWLALGKFPNPTTGESQFDEAWARYYIDMVGILAEKTSGNLDKDEAQIIEVNLSSLRLTFIEEQKAHAGKPETGTQETGTQETGTQEVDTPEEKAEGTGEEA